MSFRKLGPFLVLWLLMFISGSWAFDPRGVAQEFVADLMANRPAAAEARMTGEFRQALGPTGTGELSKALQGCSAGPVDLVKPVQGFQVVEFPLNCAGAMRTASVTVDSSGRVAGFFLQPRASVAAGVTETAVRVGREPWQVPGIVTLPAGENRVPVVVLLGGSGATDRDSTVGPNKPFRDIANGLAAQGIGVLRFDKRSLVHGAAMAADQNATLDQEYVEDALAAIELLRTSPRVDPGRIFVLGHSLGAVALPRIARRDPAISGLIFAAAPASAITESLPRQIRYIIALDGTITPEEQQHLDAVVQQVEMIRSIKAGGSTVNAPLLGAWPAYWKDMAAHDPIEMAVGLPQRMMFLQGGRDYQVLPEEGAVWKQRFDAAGRSAVWHFHPELNHLFLAGEGQPGPAEYAQPGSVSQNVIAQIAAFVKEAP